MHTFRERLSSFRGNKRQRKKLLKEIEKESKINQQLQDRKSLKAVRERRKQLKAELKQFKQKEKEERKQRRKERIQKVRAFINKDSKRLDFIKKSKNSPKIDSSGVA